MLYLNLKTSTMNRTITLITFLFAFVSLQAQQVMPQQRTLLTKKTATWCPYCGTWGWTLMKNIITDNDDKALIVGAHFSGDLMTDASTELVSIFGGAYQPVFYANTTNLNVNSGNIASKRTEIKNIVDNTYAQMPVVNAGLEVNDLGDKLSIDVKTEFFQSATGDYNVAIWVLENDVENYQASQGPNAKHPYVLRTTVNGVTGDQFSTGAVSAGTTSEWNFEFEPDASWDMDNLSFAAVIWKDNGGSYEFVNGYSVDEILISTSNEDLQSSADFTIRPSILRNQSQIVFEMNREVKVDIKIHDLLGTEVKRFTNKTLVEGRTIVNLDRTDFGRSGMYLVSVEMDGELFTKRLVVE